jgi:zinc protease
LKVLIQEEHTAPLVSVWCWYKVGSKDERPGLTGVSHWVEHMNFKGSTNIPRDEVKGIIEQFGGTWNGYTWIDQTTYLETASKDALDRMLFIESERMANCLYDPEDCESERTVIIAELQGGENDPDQLLDQELTATAFKAHRYQHPTIGWISDLRTMTRDDLYGYYRRYYIPNNATLVIVGDVDPDEALERVEHFFGRIPVGEAPVRFHTAEPEQSGERRLTLRRQGTTAYLKVGYHAPSVTDGHFFPLLLLDAVLTGAKGMNLWSSFRVAPPQRSARLYRALVECALASAVSGALLPTIRFCTPCPLPRPKAPREARWRPCCSRSSTGSGATGSPRANSPARRRSCGRVSCSKATASLASPTSWDTSRRSPASTSSRACRRALRPSGSRRSPRPRARC